MGFSFAKFFNKLQPTRVIFVIIKDGISLTINEKQEMKFVRSKI